MPNSLCDAMAIFEFEGRSPKVGKGTWIAENADVIGDVSIGRKCYIGPGARIRGDYGTIIIGDSSSIQENCVIHARPGETVRIGGGVSVGHGAVIHGATIHDNCVIGMGSIVSDWAVVREWGVVAEGAVVCNSQEVSPGVVVGGVPAKMIGRVDDDYKAKWREFKELYASLASDRYPKGLKKIG